MSQKFSPTEKEREAIARNAQPRMIARARSWLADEKVRKSLLARSKPRTTKTLPET